MNPTKIDIETYLQEKSLHLTEIKRNQIQKIIERVKLLLTIKDFNDIYVNTFIDNEEDIIKHDNLYLFAKNWIIEVYDFMGSGRVIVHSTISEFEFAEATYKDIPTLEVRFNYAQLFAIEKNNCNKLEQIFKDYIIKIAQPNE